MASIKLGVPGGLQPPSTGRPVDREAEANTRGVDPSARVAAARGYSFGATHAAEAVPNAAKLRTAQIQPWILYTFVGSCVLGALIIIASLAAGAPETGRLNFDNEPLLAAYQKYRAERVVRGFEKPLPTVDEVRRELHAIAFIENTAGEKEASRAWQILVLRFDGDEVNPVYKLAVSHLKRVQ